MPELLHVGPDYVHYPKQALRMDLIKLNEGLLKIYHVEKPGDPVPQWVAQLADATLVRDANRGLDLEGDFGFVILHRCGKDFHFLLVTVWRGSNEAWEAVWYHQGDMPDFAPFEPACPPRPGMLRPTFCVWELGVVAHEAKAWSRLLASERGEADLARWCEDWFSGEV